MSKPIYTTAVEAEAAFYDALARFDLEAMMATWSEDDPVYCVHPGGPRIAGLAAIQESWRQLFAQGHRLQIRLSQHTAVTHMMMAVHSLLAHIALEGDDPLSQPPVLATNVFTRGAHGWRIAAHHASPLADSDPFFTDATPHIVH